MFYGDRKTVVLISPEPWEGFKVSKHHYAEELGLLGHRVVFIEPPNRERTKTAVEIRETGVPGVSVLSYRTWFPYRLKFHARPLFNLGMRQQANLIRAAIGGPIDIVWDMDIAYNFIDLRVLAARFNIFHPVDPDKGIAKFGDKDADLVLSVSQAIIDPLCGGPRPAYVIPHGLGRLYEAFGKSIILSPPPVDDTLRPRVAYVGNLDRVDIDWPIIVKMVRQHTDTEFWFIGPHDKVRYNPVFAQLEMLDNCFLPGLMKAEQILELAPTIDVWLACYDPAKSIRAGMNSHKVLEYLATGRSVLSNRFDVLAGTDLVVMPDSLSNETLPQCLTEILANRRSNNSPARQRLRVAHALQFTYAAHLRRIDGLIEATGLARIDRI